MTRNLIAAACAMATSILFAAQDGASALAAIRAAREKLTAEFAASLFSPFSAVASRYFSGDETARVVVVGDGVAFAGAAAPRGLADVSFDGREIRVAPVAGGPALALLKKVGDGGVEAGPGSPVRGRLRVGAEEVIRVDRFYLETGARPGSGRAIVYDPAAPLRKAFNGLHWFPADAAYQVRAAYAPFDRPDPIVVTTSRGLQKDYFRAGALSFELDGQAMRLVALATSASPKVGDELFVPFRDATTGHESYAVGRYLSVAFQGPRADYRIDFNLATNPYCAYSPHYNCVIPPKENTLPIPIRAGEMTYAKH